MVFPITHSQALRETFTPSRDGSFGTSRLIARLTDFRNDPAPVQDGRREQRDWEAIVGRRLVATFGYPAMALIAAIEAVVRVVLALGALIPSVAYAVFAGSEPFWFVVVNGGMGLLFGPDIIVRCGVAFVKNFYSERLTFEDFRLCCQERRRTDDRL